MRTTSRPHPWKPFAAATVLALSLLVGAAAEAAAAPVFTCQLDSTGTPYCLYNGPVEQVYVNAWSTILLYWDSSVRPLVLDAAANAGIQGVTQNSAGRIEIVDNPDFAHHFSNYALAAEITGREVSIQMRGTVGGYLKIDRIWLK